MEKTKGDFSQGSILGHILRLSLPYMLAEFVHVMYNIVDRMFIGHIPGEGTLALSSVGVVFPLITFINAFAGLWSTGGSPICAIKRGEQDDEGAKAILETCITMMVVTGLVLTFFMFPTMRWTLRWMGADEQTYPYASAYFSVYLLGAVFTLISLGANPFINMMGYPITGMMTVLIGAFLNIVLDPVFIFVFDMGVRGAAWATVISQFISAVWAIWFLVSKKAPVRMTRFHVEWQQVPHILGLGVSGFMFKMTSSLTQAVANITLRIFGGASGNLYIGAMSIINSMREVVSLPITACAHSGQPVISYNYGAKLNKRVASSITTLFSLLMGYGIIAWAIAEAFPGFFVSIFTPDQDLVDLTIPCFRIFFGVFFCMSLQNAGQNTYVALNCPKRAVFFSIFRKVILVTPLTLLLPSVGFGVYGVFLAELISQLIGGTCCFITMMLSIYRKVKRTPDGVKAVF